MMGLIIGVHVIVCTLLIILILIQRGRGGGLAESFHDVESVLGTKTNAFLTRTTTVLSILFFITCLTLAILSIKQSRSLIKDTGLKTQVPMHSLPVTPVPAAESTKQAAPQAPKVENKQATDNTQSTAAPKTEIPKAK